MKTRKILATLLALVCVMALFTVPAFAAASNETKTSLPNDKTVAVNGKFDDKGTTDTVYSVDIAWGSMEFTYTSTGTKTWDPVNHEYEKGTDVEEKWTFAEGANIVTVTNHSNAAVQVDITFNKVADDYGPYTGSMSNSSTLLAAGVEHKPGEAATVTSALTLDGSLNHTVKDFTKLGDITITLSKES